MSKEVGVLIVVTILMVFLTGWFYLTNRNIEDIENKETVAPTVTATPSATLKPTLKPVYRPPTPTPQPTQTPSSESPQNNPVPQVINNTTIVNPTTAPEPTSEPTQPQPTPDERRCIINLLGIEVCL